MHDPSMKLHDAVSQRNADDVDALLKAGHDPNALDGSGQPPLRYVLNNEVYAVGFVLEAATERMLRALLAAGADPALVGVGRALVKEADSMVSSAGEASESDRFARLLGVKR